MQTKPFLSIIVPVYNVAPYLRECLDSLSRQDAEPSEYEVICVDDGSTDESGKMLDAFASGRSNFSVLHRENGGLSAARNTGLDRARGEYVWFVDSDDFIADCCLGGLITLLKEKRPDLLFVRPAAFTDGVDTSAFHVPNAPGDESSADYAKWLWTRLYNLGIIRESGVRFVEGLAYVEDNLFCAELRPYIKNELQCEVTAYFYRKRAGGLSGTPTKLKLDGLIHACGVFKRRAEEQKVSVEDAAFILCPTMMPVMSEIASEPRKEAAPRIKLLRELGLFPLPEKYRRRQECDTSGLSGENRVLKKLKYRSFTLSGYYALRTVRLLIRVKRHFIKSKPS